MATIDTTPETDIEPAPASCCGATAVPRATLADRSRAVARAAGAPVWGMAAILALLALATESQAMASAAFTIEAFINILPFILASVAIAAGLKAAGLGLEFAVVKTIAAVGMGMFAGFLALALSRAGLLSDVLKPIATPSCGASGAPDRAKPPVWRFWRQADRRATFREAALGNFVFLGRWLMFAFLLESLMLAYVPDTLVAT